MVGQLGLLGHLEGREGTVEGRPEVRLEQVQVVHGGQVVRGVLGNGSDQLGSGELELSLSCLSSLELQLKEVVQLQHLQVPVLKSKHPVSSNINIGTHSHLLLS